MLLILLKSSACLAVFMLFYKLCLEKTSANIFKRFYLIAVILISICIPFIVFTEHIETEPVNLTVIEDYSNAVIPVTIESQSFQNHLPAILWSIYTLGVILFSIRFFKNLYQIFQKIKANPKYKNQNYINVLLHDLIHPHTFFNYIFLNKNKYEHNLIPTEVLLHEQTHAKQMHALDILFIEILQIIFWFNPLLYFIKKDIKLNHEFLADQAVINKGVNTKHYQQLLLAFSSNVSHNPLANAINYSLIKKRFTVMKTKTSKTVLWLRSLIILPLLAILIYSFSSRNVIEKQLENSITNKKEGIVDSQKKPQELDYKNEQIQKNTLVIKVVNNETIFINDKNYPLKDVEKQIVYLVNNFSIEEKEKLTPVIISNSPDGDETLRVLKNILKKHNLLKTNLKPKINISPETNTIYASNQQKATPKQLAEYNMLAKKYNNQPKGRRFIKLKDVKRLEYLYSLMSKKQKVNAEPFPDFPPPPPAPPAVKEGEISDIPEPPTPPKVKKGEASDIPPPPPPAPKVKEGHLVPDSSKTGFIEINGKDHFYSIRDGKTKYYNRLGVEVDKQGNKLSTKQTDGRKVVEGQKITKVYKGNKVVSEFKKTWDDEDINQVLSPPEPKAPLDYVIEMAKKDATFYYNSKKVSSDKAIELMKNNKSLNISSKTHNGVYVVKLQTEPITISH